MSNEQAKFNNSKRRHKNDVAIARQMRIAKAAHLPGTVPGMDIKQPHRLHKRHAMDCGNPQCYLCGNPRKTHKDKLTQQEKRLFQDTEQVRDKHSNGLTPDDQSEL
jgi:hypothetical protein